MLCSRLRWIRVDPLAHLNTGPFLLQVFPPWIKKFDEKFGDQIFEVPVPVMCSKRQGCRSGPCLTGSVVKKTDSIKFTLIKFSLRVRPVTGKGRKFCDKITNWRSGFVRTIDHLSQWRFQYPKKYVGGRGRRGEGEEGGGEEGEGEERGEGEEGGGGGEGDRGGGGEGLPKAEADEQASTSTTDWPGEKKTGLTGPFFPDITLCSSCGLFHLKTSQKRFNIADSCTGLGIRITLMRIRILLFTSMRIRILLFTSMRIRIRLITLMPL
jgi:hypothetical protein